MIVKGMSPEHVGQLIARVSARNFGGNLIAKRKPEAYRGAVRFTLAIKDSRGPGHRLGFSRNAASGKRRRLAAACYHAYGEVIRELLELGAEYVQTAPIMLERARNKGARPSRWTRETWKKYADAMAEVNIGSQFEPLAFCDACECGQGNPAHDLCGMPDHDRTAYPGSPDWKGYTARKAVRA